MCPICDIECDFWYYQDECRVTWFSLLFDNLGTVIFAAFMSIWAVLFMEMWKRRQFVLQHEWDMLGYEAAEVRAHTHTHTRARTHTLGIGEQIPYVLRICLRDVHAFQ